MLGAGSLCKSLILKILHIATKKIRQVPNNVLKSNNYFAKRSDLVKKVKLLKIN